MINGHVISYAQNREDILLSGFFSGDEIGFYVDVGAEYPDTLSVTKNFYDRGWRGINIEPIKREYELFVKRRPRDINLNLGISNKPGLLTFREYEGTGYSTFSKTMMEEHRNDEERLVKKFKDYRVPTKTLAQVFKEQQVGSIQFLKVDVEGFEYEVLDGNDWEKFRPEVICIEANHIEKDWRPMLRRQGYSLVFFDGLNNYYTDDKTSRAKQFDYVKTIIYNEPIVNFYLLNDFDKYDKTVAWLDKSKKQLESVNEESARKLEEAQAQINYLQTELAGPLKRHIKRHIKRRVLGADRRITNKLSRVNNYTPQPIGKNVNAEDVALALDAAKINDTANFLNYNRPVKHHPLLPVYSKSKQVTLKAGRKGLRRIRRPRP